MSSETEKIIIDFFKICGIECSALKDLHGMEIQRDTLLNREIYKTVVKEYLPQLKCIFNTSYMNALHSSAEDKQIFPLLNLVRQIMKSFNYTLEPKRFSNGYTKTGKKLYRRVFIIRKLNISSL
jgi:hypothetical protein